MRSSTVHALYTIGEYKRDGHEIVIEFAPRVWHYSVDHDHGSDLICMIKLWLSVSLSFVYIGLDILAITDLAKVQIKIWKSRTKWYHLGLLLGVPVDTLDAIQYNHPTNCDQCFTDMIKEWLRASNLQRTWEALAKALESPQVGHSNLAEQIRSHYSS